MAIAEAAASKAEAKKGFAWIDVDVTDNDYDLYNNQPDTTEVVASAQKTCGPGFKPEEKFTADMYGEFVITTECVSSTEEVHNVVEETTITEHTQVVTFGSQSWTIHFCQKGGKIVECEHKHFKKGAFDITNAKMYLTNFFHNFHGSYESRITILRRFLTMLES